MREGLIVPTYGFINSDPTSVGSNGTKARVEVARQLVANGVVAHDCIVPFPQKILPRRSSDSDGRSEPLGKNVADYVRSLPEFGEAHVLHWYQTNGTYDDTITSLKALYFETDMDDAVGDGVHVHFVSDITQLGRLWIIWHVAFKHEVTKYGWHASFHLVPNFRTLRDILFHEPPAYLKCLWLSLHRRFFAV